MISITVTERGVYLIISDGNVLGFFTRDEKSGENLIFTAQKAGLDEIKALFEQSTEVKK